MSLRHKTVGGLHLVTADCCGRIRYSNEVEIGRSDRQRGFLICKDHLDEDHPLDDPQPLGPEPRPLGRVTGRPTVPPAPTPYDPTNDPDYHG